MAFAKTINGKIKKVLDKLSKVGYNEHIDGDTCSRRKDSNSNFTLF